MSATLTGLLKRKPVRTCATPNASTLGDSRDTVVGVVVAVILLIAVLAGV